MLTGDLQKSEPTLKRGGAGVNINLHQVLSLKRRVIFHYDFIVGLRYSMGTAFFFIKASASKKYSYAYAHINPSGWYQGSDARAKEHVEDECKAMLHGARSVPGRCPVSARYSARSVPGRKNTQKMKCKENIYKK